MFATKALKLGARPVLSRNPFTSGLLTTGTPPKPLRANGAEEMNLRYQVARHPVKCEFDKQ